MAVKVDELAGADSHCTVGEGCPVAVAVKLAVCAASTFWSAGWAVTVGGDVTGGEGGVATATASSTTLISAPADGPERSSGVTPLAAPSETKARAPSEETAIAVGVGTTTAVPATPVAMVT